MLREMNVHQKLSRGRHLAGQKAPYLQSMLLSFAPMESTDVSSFASTKDMILVWNPEAVKDWPLEHIEFAWWHECWHVLLKHHIRNQGKDPFLYNLAGDLFINDQAKEAGFKMPDFVALPEQFGLSGNLSTDEYYEALLKRAEEAQETVQNILGSPGEGSEGSGGTSEATVCPPSPSSDEHAASEGSGKEGQEDGKESPGEGNSDKDDQPGSFGAGRCGSCAGHEVKNEPSGASEGGRSEIEVENQVKKTAQAVSDYASKSRGSLPRGLRRWAAQALKPAKVRWQTMFSRCVRRAVAYKAGCVDRRYSRPNRRQAALGYDGAILPGFVAPIPDVAFVLDTSGSMRTEQVGAALSEAEGILKAINADVTFVACDASVHELQKVASARELQKLVTGGGGTDFRPAFEALQRLRQRPHVVVFATDGYGPAPESPPGGMEVIWLLIGSDYRPCEWGTFIKID